jgi:hypothetical protein
MDLQLFLSGGTYSDDVIFFISDRKNWIPMQILAKIGLEFGIPAVPVWLLSSLCQWQHWPARIVVEICIGAAIHLEEFHQIFQSSSAI